MRRHEYIKQETIAPPIHSFVQLSQPEKFITAAHKVLAASENAEECPFSFFHFFPHSASFFHSSQYTLRISSRLVTPLGEGGGGAAGQQERGLPNSTQRKRRGALFRVSSPLGGRANVFSAVEKIAFPPVKTYIFSIFSLGDCAT